MLVDVQSLMRSYVFDCVRTNMCTLTLDRGMGIWCCVTSALANGMFSIFVASFLIPISTAFESKGQIAQVIGETLNGVMKQYGYYISGAQITDLKADRKVEVCY